MTDPEAVAVAEEGEADEEADSRAISLLAPATFPRTCAEMDRPLRLLQPVAPVSRTEESDDDPDRRRDAILTRLRPHRWRSKGVTART